MGRGRKRFGIAEVSLRAVPGEGTGREKGGTVCILRTVVVDMSSRCRNGGVSYRKLVYNNRAKRNG